MYPALQVNLSVVKNNIKSIIELSQQCGVQLRPHVKTIGSKQLFDVYLKNGINKITVTSARMAYDFLLAGYTDIMLAMPLNIYEETVLCDVVKNKSLKRVVISIDNIETLKTIKDVLKNKNCYFSIEIDSDYGRSGVIINDKEKIEELLKYIIKQKLQNKLYSIYSHFGQVYRCKNLNEIEKVNKTYISKLVKLNQYLQNVLNKQIIISIGDTPSLAVYNANLLKYIQEIRPGNFVYYDFIQYVKGICKINQIAVKIIAPVISVKETYVIVHCGAIHLSKENIRYKNKKIYGVVVNDKMNIIGYVSEITQEHGIVKFFNKNNSYRIGDLLQIIPVHSCLTVELMSSKNYVKIAEM